MKKLYNTLHLVIVFLLFLSSSTIVAQHSNSLFFMDRIPQSNQLNPAVQPLNNFYFGIPGTNMEINGGNSAVSFSDIFLTGYIKDSLVYPTYNMETKNNLLSKLKETSYVFSDFRSDLLSFGFRYQRTYLSFNISERIESYSYLPKDLVKFGLFFNGSNNLLASESFDISNLGVKSQWYREFGIGVSQEINPKFTFGIRAKLLLGIANVTTANSTMQLNNTGLYEWQTKSAIEINASVPGLIVPEVDGEVQWDSIDVAEVNNFSDARDLFLKSKNVGFGLDLGIISRPVKNLTISASVVDLGFIRWKDNVHNLVQDGQYDFKGVIINSITSDEDVAQVMVDSLEKVYKVTTNHEAYTTGISGKLYAGAHYQLLKSVGLGAMSRFQLVKQNIRPQLTLSLNLTSGNWMGTTFSYTIADGMYDNFGIGWVAKMGWFQYYFITDRIPLAYDRNVGSGPPIIPKYFKSFNFRTGFNLVIGNRRKIKADKDKPFVEI